MTEAQRKAVEVLHGQSMTVGEFIHKMWPEKVGANEKISGGFVLAACCLLNRMKKVGLAIQVFDDVSVRWKLSNFGVSIFYAIQRERVAD